MDISLTKMPWYAQVGAFLVLAAAGVVSFYWYYEMPLQKDMLGRQQQLVLLKANISKGLATAKKLPEFRGQVKDLEARLNSLKAVLPDGEWHGSRSTMLVHLTTRYAVWSNATRRWLGREVVSGPATLPADPGDSDEGASDDHA